MPYTTHVDDVAIREYVSKNDGPVQRDLHSRAVRVQAGAKAMAGVKTGHLKASIQVKHEIGRKGIPQYRIGSPLSYALMHHEGTRPHLIHPRLRRTLRFRQGGRTVYATIVHHPGTRANRYLTIPLGRYGIG